MSDPPGPLVLARGLRSATALALPLGAVTPTLVVGQLVVAAIAVAVHVALIGRRAA